MKKFLIALSFSALLGGVAFGQSGNRTFGSQQLQLDDNNPAHARIYLTTVNGSLGIDQSGIPTPGVFPSSCALLDLSSTTQGFLAPRMTTAQEALICGGTPTEGLIVYNLTNHSLDVWNGSAWGQAWSTKGNSGTNPATDFLGTKDNVDLVFRTNNTERARILANGTINIPTTSASGPGVITQNGNRFIHSSGGTTNFFAGTNAGNLSTTGIGDVGIGQNALTSNTTGGSNIAIGNAAMATNTIGSSNVGVGNNALNANSSGTGNTAVGNNALLSNTLANGNTAVGAASLQIVSTGGNNTAVGLSALGNVTSGNGNVALGFNAGAGIAGGSSNSFLGTGAGATADVTHSTVIGSGAQVSQSNTIVLGSGEFVGVGIPNPGTLFTNANTNMVDQGGDGETAGSMQWLYNSNGYVASFQNINSAVVNPHGILVKAAKTTPGTRVFVANSGAGNGIDRFTVQGDGAVIVGGGGTLNVSNSTLTNNVSVVNGVADATIASTAANNVWDSRIIGDQLVTGVQKIGGSIWLDGTSATHSIVTDAPTNIGTKNANNVSIITNNVVRETIDASGNVTDQGNLQVNGSITDQGNLGVNGTVTLGSGGTAVKRIFSFTAPFGSTFTQGANSVGMTSTSVGITLSATDQVLVQFDQSSLSAGGLFITGYAVPPNTINLAVTNPTGSGITVTGGVPLRITVIQF